MSTESTVSVAIPAALAAEILEMSPEGQSIGEAVGGLLRMILDDLGVSEDAVPAEPPTEAELEPLIVTPDYLGDLSKAKHERLAVVTETARGVVQTTWQILEHGNSEARKAALRAAILDYQVAKDFLLHAGDISPIENNDILAARQRINDRKREI